MVKVQTLSSGSAGNIAYIGSDTTRILVDIGLSLPQTLKRLKDANIDPKTISAILITHEHSDHILGVSAFVKKFATPIYCHREVKKILKKYIGIGDDGFIEHDDGNFVIGDITVNFFQVPHDSEFCFGYTFTLDGTTIGIATDIGKMTPTIIANLALCHVIILESNHDTQKLQCNTKYPYWLKRRIVGEHGHLSNTECANTILALSKGSVGQVILAHLSEENNSPRVAFTTIKDFLTQNGVVEGQDIFIDIAPQHTIGNLYCI
jgi:phosphoribosyl 1,2-cyclic phosphodiesterase